MNADFAEDSDTSDDDYVPSGPGASTDIPSEVDSDGDSEEPLSDSEDVKPVSKRRRKSKQAKKEIVKTEDPEEAAKKELTQEEKKKHADSLWASFKKDTGFKAKTASNDSIQDTTKTSSSSTCSSDNVESKTKTKAKVETVKVTQIFEFAGEEVKVEKEVKADSAEARLSLTNAETETENKATSSSKRKGGGLGGIGSVLSQIGKKQKLSTLEKTKLDWNNYKRKEDIEDELENYKKGKDGYLERQDFLQRADVRRFEIEREVRTIERNKRLNLNNGT